MSNNKGSRACMQVARVRSMPNATCRFRGCGSTRVHPRSQSSAHEGCVGAHTAKNLRWSGRVRTDAAEEDLPTRDRPPSSLLPHGPMARRQLAGRVQVGPFPLLQVQETRTGAGVRIPSTNRLLPVGVRAHARHAPGPPRHVVATRPLTAPHHRGDRVGWRSSSLGWAPPPGCIERTRFGGWCG